MSRPGTDELDTLGEEKLRESLLREDIRARRSARGLLTQYATPVATMVSAGGTVLALFIALSVARSNSAMNQLAYVERKAEALEIQQKIERLRGEERQAVESRKRMVDEVKALEAQRDVLRIAVAARKGAAASGRGVSMAISRLPTEVAIAIDSYPQGARVTAFLACRGDFAFPERTPRVADCSGKGLGHGGDCGVTPCRLGTFSRLPNWPLWVRLEFGQEEEWRYVNIGPPEN